MASAMAQASGPLRPSFGDATRRHGSQVNANLHKNRFVFSPFALIDCRNNVFGRVGFDYIQPGRIHMISDFTYPVPNQKRLESGNTSEPEFADFTWEAGYIYESIMRGNEFDSNIPTGFNELSSLFGLDPDASQSDAELLMDIQQTLLLSLPETGFKMLEELMGREAFAEQKGAIYTATLERMIQLTNDAVDYIRLVASELRDGMAQRQAGVLGHRGRLFADDKRLFAWIEEKPPELRSPFEGQAQVVAQAALLPSAIIPDTPRIQCDSCGAYANLIAKTNLPPKKCAVCGEGFEAVSTEPQAVSDVEEFAEVTGGRRSLETKQAEARERNKVQ